MIYEGIRSYEEWFEQSNEFFIIRYHPDHISDVEEAFALANWVRENTQVKYPHCLGMKVTITLCKDRKEIQRLTREDRAGYSRVGLNIAKIFILTPSWSGSWDEYEKMDNPFRRVLNHEYVHCPFWQDRACAKIHGGYPDDELPRWFNQGIAEYISNNYLKSYEECVKESVKQRRFDINNEYAWGIYIMEYMYRKFQQNRVINLVRSESPTFNEAIQTELGVNRQDFDDGWKQYLIEKFLGTPS